MYKRKPWLSIWADRSKHQIIFYVPPISLYPHCYIPVHRRIQKNCTSRTRPLSKNEQNWKHRENTSKSLVSISVPQHTACVSSISELTRRKRLLGYERLESVPKNQFSDALSVFVLDNKYLILIYDSWGEVQAEAKHIHETLQSF